MAKNKYILGLDAATKNTGVAILDLNYNIIHYELLESDFDNVYDRFSYIYKQIGDIIYKYDIDIVVIEDVAIGSKNNLQRGKELSILQGVILGLTYTLNIPCKLYMPSRWRSLVGTYDGTREGTHREMQKQKAVDIVNDIYSLDFKYFKTNTKKNGKSDDDIAEAILLCVAYLRDNGYEK